MIGKLLERAGQNDFKKLLSPVINTRTDNLVLSGNVSDEMFEKFESIAFQNYSANKNPRVYAHSDYRDQIELSDILNENMVEYFHSEYSSSQAIEILGNSNVDDRTLFVADSKYKDELRRWIKNGEYRVSTLYE